MRRVLVAEYQDKPARCEPRPKITMSHTSLPSWHTVWHIELCAIRSYIDYSEHLCHYV
jgi:hypothetical protein